MSDDVIGDIVQLVRTGELLRMSIVQLGHVVETLRDVHEADAQLGPELTAALTSLTAAVEALERAATFASTRFEVAHDAE